MSVLVLQHHSLPRPGLLAATLRDHGFKLDTRRCDESDPLPANSDDLDALVVHGGLQNVTEGHDWLETECALIREAHERSLPVVGICLGAQMIAHALGGDVAPMQATEIGMTPIELAQGAQSDPIFSGVPGRFHIYQEHGQEVRTLPDGAALLASSSVCKHQAFRVGARTYAFQFHFEYDYPAMLESLRGSPGAIAESGSTLEALTRGVETYRDQAERIANRISMNIATRLIPRRAGVVRV